MKTKSQVIITQLQCFLVSLITLHWFHSPQLKSYVSLSLLSAQFTEAEAALPKLILRNIITTT